jgi:hypothetical protein
VIAAHLRFMPSWVLRDLGLARGDLLAYQRLVVSTLTNLLAILAALNRLHLDASAVKRPERLIAALPLAPQRAAERFARVLSAPPDQAIGLLQALVEDALELVERHVDGVSTGDARRVLGSVIGPCEAMPPL